MKKYLFIIFFATTAASKETVTREPDRVVYEKKTMIDFSDVLITGELMKPEGTYVKSRKSTDFDALIEMRMDFQDELIDSVGNL